MFINIQTEDFNHQDLYDRLRQDSGNNAGAISTFTGLVREKESEGQAKLTALSLEHYPGMTEKSLEKIALEAIARFDLNNIIIVHRVGKLSVGAQIVFVGTASQHRKKAFDGCQFMMDYLKNDAPFWKKEFREGETEKWVEQKQTDRESISRWKK